MSTKMVSSLPDIRVTRPRNKLFFSRFTYSIGFTLPYAHVIRRRSGRVATPDEVARRWAMYNHLNETVRNYGGRWLTNNRMPDATMLQDLLTWNDWLIQRQDDVRCMANGDSCYVYCQDIDTVAEILQLPFATDPVIQQARVVAQPDELPMQQPRWQFRTYIKCMRVTQEIRHSLREMLRRQGDQIELSTSFDNWLKYGDNRTAREYFYVDHDHDNIVLMINLISPGLTGKTYRIVSVGK